MDFKKKPFFFRKPCITLRDQTEWVELVNGRFNVLVGADREKTVQAFFDEPFSDDWDAIDYGGGLASQTIVDELLNSELPRSQA